MADLTNTDTPITGNGENYFQTVPGNRYIISMVMTGTAGTVTILNAQNQAYRNTDDDADLVFTEATTIASYDVIATGRRIYLTASSFNTMSAAFEVHNRGKAS